MSLIHARLGARFHDGRFIYEETTDMNTPKQTTLQDLLSAEQLKHVQALLNNDDSDYNKTVRLKNYLAANRAELEAKEVLPEYLAYLLIYMHDEGKI